MTDSSGRWAQSPEEAFQTMLISAVEAGTRTCWQCQGRGCVLDMKKGPHLVGEGEDAYFQTPAVTCDTCEGVGKCIPDILGEPIYGVIAGIFLNAFPMLDQHDANEREYGMRLLKCAYTHLQTVQKKTFQDLAENADLQERVGHLLERQLSRIDDPGLPFEPIETAADRAQHPKEGQLSSEELADLLDEKEQ